MRPRLEKLPASGEQSFRAAVIRVRSFELFWHYHPEYELTYIVKGRGKRIVGDSVSYFNPGDLVLAGPALPHVWVSDRSHRGSCEAIVLHLPQAFVERIGAFPELQSVTKLFEASARGLGFRHEEPEEMKQLFLDTVSTKGLTTFQSILALFRKLQTLTCEPLSSIAYRSNVNAAREKRINRILEYVQQQFQREISLSEAAAQLHLSESAFCKFFKRNLNKTFSDYVNEIRVAHAAKLLLETDLPVQTIALRSGFSNQSYFNRIFFRKKKMKPLQFRVQE